MDRNGKKIYKLRKKEFTDKANVISVNSDDLFNCRFYNLHYRFNMVLLQNQLVYSDTFMPGLRVLTFYGAQLTNCFNLGSTVFLGISCYRSFKKQVKNWNLDLKLLKKFFNHYTLMKQIMAMYQCGRCFRYLERLLMHMLNLESIQKNNFDSVFSLFRIKVHYNTKKLIKTVNMQNAFMLGLNYYTGRVAPKMVYGKNSELVHDCYYDIENIDLKMVVLSDLQLYENVEDQLMKGVGSESTTCLEILKNAFESEVEAEVGLNEYDNYCTGVYKLSRGHRSQAYVDWVKKYFDVCIVF